MCGCWFVHKALGRLCGLRRKVCDAKRVFFQARVVSPRPESSEICNSDLPRTTHALTRCTPVGCASTRETRMLIRRHMPTPSPRAATRPLPSALSWLNLVRESSAPEISCCHVPGAMPPNRRESCYGHDLAQLIADSDGTAALAALAGARKVLLQRERACECGV